MQTLLPFEPSDSGTALYFVTNRSNLVEILSSGLITGRSGYDKYYPDYLQYAPDRVPLFAGPMDSSIIDAIREQGPEDAFPVILEVDPSVLNGVQAEALDEQGNSTSLPPGDSSGRVWATPAVIPRQAIRTVLFLNSEDHLNLASRPFENARTDEPPFRLIEEGFESGQVTHEEAAEWLETLTNIDEPGEESIRREDRISGGVLVATLAAEEKLHREHLASLMTGKIEDASSIRSGEVPVWLGQPLRPEDRSSFPDLPEDPDSCLFRAAVDELLKVNYSRRWNKEEVLEGIEKRFTETKADQQGKEYILKQFEYIKDVIQARRPFNGFNPGGSDVIKALLLILVRPEPSRLLSWSRDETGADDPIMVTAGLLAGIISGRKRLPADLGPAELDDRMAWKSADRLCRDSGDIVYGPSDREPPSPAPDPVKVLLGMDLNENDDARQIALAICRRRDWDDCISTILIPPGDETMEMFYTRSRKDGRRKVAAFRIRGEAELEYEVNPEEFRKRLSEDTSDLDNEIQKDIRDSLDAKDVI